MEIKKLDPERIREREPDRPVRPLSKKSKKKPDEAEKIGRKMSRKKIIIYLSIFLFFASASLIYNLVQFSSIKDTNYEPEIEESTAIETVFHGLSLSLEQEKEVTGKYPASLTDFNFSPHLEYTINKDGTFLLVHNDSNNLIVYDSRKEAEQKTEDVRK